MAVSRLTKAAIIRAMALCFALPLVARAAEPQAEKIADLPNPASITSLAISLDCRHVAMIIINNRSNSLWLDGKVLLNTTDTLRNLLLSPDGSHVACVQSTPSQAHTIIDGISGAAYDEIGPTAGSLLFSPDGAHVACTARKANQWFILLDGKETPAGDAAPSQLTFSDDGKHLAYVMHTASGYAVVLDNHQGPIYRAIRELHFFQDNQSAYIAVRSDSNCLGIIGSQTLGPYIDIASLTLSNDRKRSALVAQTGANDPKFKVVTDGKASRSYYEVTAGPVFSADSQHYAFNARTATVSRQGFSQGVFVTDGISKDGIHMLELLLSPDGSRQAYTEWESPRNGPLYYFSFNIDGERIGDMGDSAGGIVFSTDGKHCACALCTMDNDSEAHWSYLVDKEMESSCHSVSPLIFSPDGKHHAYAAQTKQGNWTIIFDASELAQYELLRPTIDGGPEGPWRTVEDVGARLKMTREPNGVGVEQITRGNPKPEDFKAAQVPYAFYGDNSFSFLAIKQGAVFRVHVP